MIIYSAPSGGEFKRDCSELSYAKFLATAYSLEFGIMTADYSKVAFHVKSSFFLKGTSRQYNFLEID